MPMNHPSEEQICQNGVCLFIDEDNDGDGFLAADECDDFDAEVHPGVPDVCDGVDNDCDEATLDGHDSCEGLCCGEPPACQACCSPEQCGEGDWSCATMVCECPGVEVDGECLGGAACTPGEEGTENQPCGDCGTQSRTRTCEDAGAWGAWSAWSACEGDVVCFRSGLHCPGESVTEFAGDCGDHTCTCESDGSWTCGPCG